MARDLWAPVELQALGYAETRLEQADSAYRLRQACLLLSMAAEMDSANSLAWQDLLSVLMSDAVNDTALAAQVIARYSSMEPEDNAPIDEWLRYMLQTFNERKERENFLQQNIPALGDYP